MKGVNGKNVEEKHPEGSYFLNFNNTWIPVRGDALEAQHQRKLKLNQVEYERLRGKTAPPGPNLVQFGRKIINDEVDAYLANLELAKRPHKTIQSKRGFPHLVLADHRQDLRGRVQPGRCAEVPQQTHD